MKLPGIRALALISLPFLLSGCLTKDNANVLLVSVPQQRLEVRTNGVPSAYYPVSTSKYGLGDQPGSYKTPLGRMEVAKKIGGGAVSGTVFKHRKPTGEILAPDSPGRDPIVSRILWLRGKESYNRNAYKRYIYIHGTAEERNVGRAVSYGCIRMRSNDVIDLYDRIGVGAKVFVLNGPIPPPEALPR